MEFRAQELKIWCNHVHVHLPCACVSVSNKPSTKSDSLYTFCHTNQTDPNHIRAPRLQTHDLARGIHGGIDGKEEHPSRATVTDRRGRRRGSGWGGTRRRASSRPARRSSPAAGPGSGAAAWRSAPPRSGTPPSPPGPRRQPLHGDLRAAGKNTLNGQTHQPMQSVNLMQRRRVSLQPS